MRVDSGKRRGEGSYPFSSCSDEKCCPIKWQWNSQCFLFCKPISSWQRAVALGGSWCEHHNWCSDPCIAVVLSTKTKIDVPLNTHPFRKFLTCVLDYVKFSYLLSPSFPNSFIHSDLLSGLVLITHESLLSLQSREKDSARQKPLAVCSTQKVIVQLEWFMGPGWLGLFPPPPHSLHTFVPMSSLGILPWSSPCCITTISLFLIFFFFFFSSVEINDGNCLL